MNTGKKLTKTFISLLKIKKINKAVVLSVVFVYAAQTFEQTEGIREEDRERT